MLGPLHLPHQLEVGRDGGAAITRPLQVVEHHYFEGVGVVLRVGEMVVARETAHTLNTCLLPESEEYVIVVCLPVRMYVCMYVCIRTEQLLQLCMMSVT